ncbi:MAG: hypothetical protein ABUT20_26110 [Bacteroidota bacterium]
MKIIIFCFLFLLTFSAMSMAQCDKPVQLTSAKTEYLDAEDSVQHTEMENSLIVINKTEIIIIPAGDDERKMTGKINSTVCHWTKPFKEGKTIIKAVFINRAGETKNGTITIEGKDGKVTFIMQAAENPEFRIKVIAEKFEEIK